MATINEMSESLSSSDDEIPKNFHNSGTREETFCLDTEKENASHSKESTNDEIGKSAQKPKEPYLGVYHKRAVEKLFEEEQNQLTPSKRIKKRMRKTPVGCTVAFLEENSKTVQHLTISERVVELLNEATIMKGTTLKNLRIVQELIIHSEPKLLENFLDNVVAFQHSVKVEVRKFIASFIELACKTNPNIVPKIIENLTTLLNDSSPVVQKQMLQTITSLYKTVLRWICSAKPVLEVMEATWTSMTKLKPSIFTMLHSENDSVSAEAIRFMEAAVLAQTYRDQYTTDTGISLDDVPTTIKFLQPYKMEKEAKEVFEKLITFQAEANISDYNLKICIISLSSIGKKRFEYYSKVLNAFESLHATLECSQSVQQGLKVELISLSKHPASEHFFHKINALMTSLKVSPQQIERCFRTVRRKQQKNFREKSLPKKVTDIRKNKFSARSNLCRRFESSRPVESARFEVTAENVYSKLTVTNVADLTFVALLNLPDIIPEHFQSGYTPIVGAGTEPQIRHLAKLLAIELTTSGFGRSIEMPQAAAIFTRKEKVKNDEMENCNKSKQTEMIIKGMAEIKGTSSSVAQKDRKHLKRKSPDFSEEISPKKEKVTLTKIVYEKILNTENSAAKYDASAIRAKILVNLATQFGGVYSMLLRKHIAEDLDNRIDLVFSWLFEEYAAYKGYNGSISSSETKYEEIALSLVGIVLENEELKHVLFPRFFTDSPHITLDMIVALRDYCVDEDTAKRGIQIAKTMTLLMPPKRLEFLGIICDLTLHEELEVRDQAVSHLVELFHNADLQPLIEAFAAHTLMFLLEPNFPSIPDFLIDLVIPTTETVGWDDLANTCLHLFFSLMPVGDHLIHKLATVYIQLSTDKKLFILRFIEVPAKDMNMHSSELLKFVENFPKGAETLVMRLIHVLTDKAPPSSEIVSSVRLLYKTRIPDIRILIPVISGLPKTEIICALPELIQLNPIILKVVFSRLLSTDISTPLSSAELLIALHNIDSSTCSLKTIMNAISMCLAEKTSYTKVVLIVVIQQLLKQTPLPLLLMRTVIQSLTNYPELSRFVNNILKNLIEKQVWKHKKIWEGFIKCCQRTKPHSFQILLQLPSQQLEEVLQAYPDLRHSLNQHINDLADHQTDIPQDSVKVLNAFKLRPNIEISLSMNDSNVANCQVY